MGAVKLASSVVGCFVVVFILMVLLGAVIQFSQWVFG